MNFVSLDLERKSNFPIKNSVFVENGRALDFANNSICDVTSFD